MSKQAQISPINGRKNGTPIEWTHIPGYTGETLNPVIAIGPDGKRGWHCEVVSAGCKNCYAEKMNRGARFLGTGRRYQLKQREEVKIELHEPTLLKPLSWKQPRAIFWMDMSDAFGEWVPFEWIDKFLAIAALTPQHIHMFLTKRPERMAEYFATHTGLTRAQLIGIEASRVGGRFEGTPFPLHNVWLGTSVEDQKAADTRIPHLLRCPAAVRFLSCEPLLGPVDLTDIPWPEDRPRFPATDDISDSRCSLSEIEGTRIHWVIAGGESGPGARPMHPDWPRSLRDQCETAGVPFFFKQWGAWLPWSDFCDNDIDDNPEITRFDTMEWDEGKWRDVGRPMWCDTFDGDVDGEQCVGKVGKHKAGRILDGKTHGAFPEVAS